ncbi:carbonic anhydrase [Sporocytophaga myxococcoides]|uniref:carbonic anhydrase n=1 Tax=Sporocytophaga myxococcoides TaxID=153721 RepID=UPI00040831F5|nr:carbonic anhydrase [Sporocytophaga myxococcoides]
MIKSYNKLLEGNRKWAAEQLEKDANYFEKLSKVQKPEYLWIGCSDSRVPCEVITGAIPGEIFVHRNIANMVIHTDLNLLSVLEYAVKFLKVKHIILCGHYGCGGIQSSMDNIAYGYVDNWLRNIKEIYVNNIDELEALPTKEERVNRLVEINVVEQVKNLCKTKVVQIALEQKTLKVHGWVYGMKEGLIHEMIHAESTIDAVHPIFKYEIE